MSPGTTVHSRKKIDMSKDRIEFGSYVCEFVYVCVCVCVCVCNWKPVCEVCTNYQVVVLQHRKVTPPHLGSVTIYYKLYIHPYRPT